MFVQHPMCLHLLGCVSVYIKENEIYIGLIKYTQYEMIAGQKQKFLNELLGTHKNYMNGRKRVRNHSLRLRLRETE